MNLQTYSYKYDPDLNLLHIINDNTEQVYETFEINPNTLNRWSGEEDAIEYGQFRITQIIASSPIGTVVTFDVKLVDPNIQYAPVDIIKKNVEYILQLTAISNAAVVDFDHNILLECKAPSENKMYLIEFVNGSGKLPITFTDSGIYIFELDSLRDSITKKLLTDLYPNIKKNEDLTIAVTDN